MESKEINSFIVLVNFPGGSDSTESACNAGALGLMPGAGRSLEKGMATRSVSFPGEFHELEEPIRLPQSMVYIKSRT